MRLKPEDLCIFTEEDANIIESYMTRNRIITLKQFAKLTDVPYYTLVTCLRAARNNGKARMMKESFDKIKKQLKREVCADNVEDGIMRLRRRIATEKFLASDQSATLRIETLQDVLTWIDSYLGVEHYAKDEGSESRTEIKNERVYRSKK